MSKEDKTIHVWITKYALTKGIYEADVSISSEDEDSYVREAVKGSYGVGFNLFHKPHWHTSHAEAVIQVRKMIKAKLASLKKQEARLKELEKTLG